MEGIQNAENSLILISCFCSLDLHLGSTLLTYSGITFCSVISYMFHCTKKNKENDIDKSVNGRIGTRHGELHMIAYCSVW